MLELKYNTFDIHELIQKYAFVNKTTTKKQQQPKQKQKKQQQKMTR
jgi:hypothetical protein